MAADGFATRAAVEEELGRLAAEHHVLTMRADRVNTAMQVLRLRLRLFNMEEFKAAYDPLDCEDDGQDEFGEKEDVANEQGGEETS